MFHCNLQACVGCAYILLPLSQLAAERCQQPAYFQLSEYIFTLLKPEVIVGTVKNSQLLLCFCVFFFVKTNKQTKTVCGREK